AIGPKSGQKIGWNLDALDLDCLIDVIDIALDNPKDSPDKNSEGYMALKELHKRLKNEYQMNFDNLENLE
ncbi:hypothetical protein, partial [Desulfobacter postgatei]|uniref:hypothetical protein n=1 Tax=Desulfobacter postgatei TaxID=2293 RepID=UPI00259AF694